MLTGVPEPIVVVTATPGVEITSSEVMDAPETTTTSAVSLLLIKNPAGITKDFDVIVAAACRVAVVVFPLTLVTLEFGAAFMAEFIPLV